jgi:predicted alpha-1,6-mannanase (GH76 family)
MCQPVPNVSMTSKKRLPHVDLSLSLSAYLASASGGSATYKNAAIAAAKWIQTHNLNSNKIVLDTVNGHDCSRSAASWTFTYNTGKFVEGLAVLSDVTGDATWRTL